MAQSLIDAAGALRQFVLGSGSGSIGKRSGAKAGRKVRARCLLWRSELGQGTRRAEASRQEAARDFLAALMQERS